MVINQPNGVGKLAECISREFDRSTSSATGISPLEIRSGVVTVTGMVVRNSILNVVRQHREEQLYRAPQRRIVSWTKLLSDSDLTTR